jgi:hypothetical protein
VLTDPTQSEEFRTSKYWKSPLLDFQLRVQQPDAKGPAYRSNSLSGNERNRLLLAGANRFLDHSLVSGIDAKEDARSFALTDFDEDGWTDIILASANAPRLRIFRNRLADLGHKGRSIPLTLTGTTSNRDAIGTLVTLETSKGKRVFRKSLGEGLSAQNSAKIPLTLAEGETLKKITLRWPSGKVSEHPIENDPKKLSFTEPPGN